MRGIHLSLWLHTIAAFFLSAVAYLAWTKPEDVADQSVWIVPGDAKSLQKIVYREDDSQVVLEKKDQRLHVTTEKISASPESVQAPKTYPGSKQAEELWNKLMPLRALRQLGKPSVDKLGAMGLDKDSTQLILQLNNSEHAFVIGTGTYGSGDTYVKNVAGDVYLLAANLLSPLRHGATTLSDKALLGVEKAEIDKVVVRVNSTTKEFLQKENSDKNKAYFVAATAPETRLPLFGAWFDRLKSLRVADIGQAPGVGDPTLVMDFFNGKQRIANIQIWHTLSEPVARSDRFVAPVSLVKATLDAVVKDLEPLMK